VTGIHPSLTEEDVTQLFEKFGEVEKCNIMKDPHTKESRGFGFVKMVTPEQADAAKEGLQGEVHQGRTLSIEKARRARPRTPTPGKYYGPPKRGKLKPFVLCPTSANSPLQSSEEDVAVAVLGSVIVTTTAVEDTPVAVTTMADIVAPDTTTATIVAMAVTVRTTADAVLTGTLGTTATLAVAMTVVAEVDTMSVLPLLLAGAEHTAETSLPLALTPTAAEAAGLMMTVVKTPPLDFDSILT
jgi:hypothetical protein